MSSDDVFWGYFLPWYIRGFYSMFIGTPLAIALILTLLLALTWPLTGAFLCLAIHSDFNVSGVLCATVYVVGLAIWLLCAGANV